QKVALAAALAMRPRLLVLDEPTTDLDPRSKTALMRTLQELEDAPAVVVVSHDLETIAPLVNRLAIVDAGPIVADRPADRIFAQPSLLPEHGIGKPYTEAPLARPHSATSGTNAVEMERVSFTYPERSAPAVDYVTLSVAAGEILAIVGNNGSGKTTLGK